MPRFCIRVSVYLAVSAYLAGLGGARESEKLSCLCERDRVFVGGVHVRYCTTGLRVPIRTNMLTHLLSLSLTLSYSLPP